MNASVPRDTGFILGQRAVAEDNVFVRHCLPRERSARIDPIFYLLQAPTIDLRPAVVSAQFAHHSNHFRRWQGMLLVACYVFFVGAQYLL
jgi:hypothetical protein